MPGWHDPLSTKVLSQALRRLGELAVEEGVVLDVSLYGGAVLTLVYDSHDATKDVDALVRSSDVPKRLSLRVARELNLVEGWLNDDVRCFLAEREAKHQVEKLDFGPGLQLTVPTAAYLLALKLEAGRSPFPGSVGDFDDIRLRVKKMNVRSLEAAAAVPEKFFPEDPLTAVQQDTVKGLIAGANRR